MHGRSAPAASICPSGPSSVLRHRRRGNNGAAGYPIYIAVPFAMFAALCVGLVNGVLIAYAGMQPFVVTLGTLAIARSLAMVFSDNRMIYQFGPDHNLLLMLGGGSMFGIANPVYFLVALALVTGFAFRWSRWGRHLFAIGGNEEAARMTEIRVYRMKVLKPQSRSPRSPPA